MMQIAREQAKSERHERLVEAHEIKRKMKQQEVNDFYKRDQEFHEWMK